MTVVIELGGYLHHQIPSLTPKEVTDKLAAEDARRNPGVGFQSIDTSTPPAAEPIQVLLPPAPTS